MVARRPMLLAMLAAAVAAGPSCEGERPPPAQATTGTATVPPPNAQLSAREVLDTADAIEKFLNAGRAREALLLARRFTERAGAGSSAAAVAAELRARACFTLSQLAGAEIPRSERAALVQEAAEWAVRAVDANPADQPIDAGRVAFAALLASNAGRTADATRLFDRAIGQAPTDRDILLQATLSALAAMDSARARALLARRRGDGSAGAAADAWNDALDAEILLAESRFAEAVVAAQRAVSQDRDALEFRLILARALRRDGRSAEAARLLSALPDEERAKPAIADQFARALAESGDAAGAAQAWDLSLRANPADPFVRAETTLAFHRAGDRARAAAEMHALEAMPGAAAETERVRAELAKDPVDK